MVHHQPQSPARTQILMQSQPYFQGKANLGREDGNHIWIAPRYAVLDKANAEAGADGREMGEVAVGPQGEMIACDRQAGQKAAYERRFLIEADQRMAACQQRCEGGERGRGGKIKPMGVKSESDCPDPPRDQRFLARAHHAHCDVGLAAQKILNAIG